MSTAANIHRASGTNTPRQPGRRLIMEVVIPIKVRRRIGDKEDEHDENTYTPRGKRVRRVSEIDTDYSPGRIAKTPLRRDRRLTRSVRRASTASALSAERSEERFREVTAGPSSRPISTSSSNSNDNLRSLATAVDFMTDPDAILVDNGVDLEMVIASSPTPDIDVEETKSAIEIDPSTYEIDMSKLSPSPEPEEVEEAGIDCGICYESVTDICKRAEEEGKGGIGGSLAIVACDQAACGAIFCLSCIIQVTNQSIRLHRPVVCPLCTRPTNLNTIRAQAMAFNPADKSDPIIAPPPLVRPIVVRAPSPNIPLQHQHIKSVIDFHRAVRPDHRYFINRFAEFSEWLKLCHPAAAQVNPAGLDWLAKSSWEAFWAAYEKRQWRGLAAPRANSALGRTVHGLQITMPPNEARVDPFALGREMAQIARLQIRNIPQGVNRGQALRDFFAPFAAGAQERRRAAMADLPEDARLAGEALAHVRRELVPPPENAVNGEHALGNRPQIVQRPLHGLDAALSGRWPAASRRAILGAIMGLRGQGDVDMIYNNLRVAYNLDERVREDRHTPAEEERMDLIRRGWAMINEGREALIAAQAHQLPVAEMLPEIGDGEGDPVVVE